MKEQIMKRVFKKNFKKNSQFSHNLNVKAKINLL